MKLLALPAASLLLSSTLLAAEPAPLSKPQKNTGQSVAEIQMNMEDKRDELKQVNYNIEDYTAIQHLLTTTKTRIETANLTPDTLSKIEELNRFLEKPLLTEEDLASFSAKAYDIGGSFMSSLDPMLPQGTYNPQGYSLALVQAISSLATAQSPRDFLRDAYVYRGTSPKELFLNGANIFLAREGGFIVERNAASTLKSKLSTTAFNTERTRLLALLTADLKTIEDKLRKLTDTRNEVRQEISRLQTSLTEAQQGQSKLDEKVLMWGLPSLGAIMLALMLVPRVYKGTAVPEEIFKSGLLLELMTVFLLTSSILLLGVSSRLDPNVLGTLLGGISGYVLGRNLKRRGDKAE